MKIKNFLFHRVTDATDALWPPMPVALFDSLIRYISRSHQVISLEDWVKGRVDYAGGKTLATILFDDGYQDNIRYAAPILQKYRCPASFYAVTQCIDLNIPTWTYQVDYLLQYTRRTSLDLHLDYVPASFRLSNFTDLASRLRLGKQLKPWMKSLSNDDRQQVLAKLQAGLSDVTVPRDQMMNWDELRQLRDAGFSVGSHSFSHPLLASICDEKELRFELEGSAARIREELGYFPDIISYPIGSYDQRVMKISRELGYQAGLAVEQRFFHPDQDDLFAIPRVELYNEPGWKCHLRMSGLYSWMRKTLGR